MPASQACCLCERIKISASAANSLFISALASASPNFLAHSQAGLWELDHDHVQPFGRSQLLGSTSPMRRTQCGHHSGVSVYLWIVYLT